MAFSLDANPEEMERRMLDAGLFDPAQKARSNFVCGSLIGLALLYSVRAIDAAHGKATADPWPLVVSAARLSGNAIGIHLGSPTPQDVAKIAAATRTVLARKAGRARAAADPKQAAKAAAFALWNERRAGKHPKLRTNEHFAAECLRQWPVLSSSKVILGWCTQWHKEAAERKSQSAS